MAEAHHAIIQGQKLAATEQDTQGEPWELRTHYRLYNDTNNSQAMFISISISVCVYRSISTCRPISVCVYRKVHIYIIQQP